jgi:hypothetical protein
MEPFSTSKVVSFILSKLMLENKTNNNYEKELKNLLERGENHIKSNHIRLFSREKDGHLTVYVDPSYGKTKVKDGSQLKSYVVEVIY